MESIYTSGLCARKKERKKGSKETTEETSEKSEELEGKQQSAYRGRELFAFKAKEN